MNRNTIFCFAAALATALSGCGTTGGVGAIGAGGDQFSAGQNLVGEDCYAQPMTDAIAANAARGGTDIYCGRWEHESARVFTLEDETASLDELTAGGWWRTALDRRVVCEGETETQILDGAEARLLECTLKNGGWPYIAIGARVGNTVYLADGIPAALPAIEVAIGVASGQRDSSADDAAVRQSAAIRQIEAQLSGRLYGSGDLDTYYQLMALGQYYNSVKGYRTAEKHYREALALQERLLGVGDPETADPMMHLALELSNQEQFLRSESLFDRAAKLVETSVDRADYARYLSYRAHHAANKRDLEQAASLARQATELREELAPTAEGIALAGQSAGGAGVPTNLLTVGDTRTNPADVVQSLYVEAAALARLGRLDEGERRLAQAEQVLASTSTAPALWEPQLLQLKGMLAAAREEAGRAEATIGDAVALFEERSPGRRPTAVAYLDLGRAYAAKGNIDQAIASFREAIKLVRTRRGGLRVSQVVPYLQTGMTLAKQRPEQANALNAELFDAAQLVRSNITTAQIALASARLASDEDKVGTLIRDLQDAQDQRDALDRAYETQSANFIEPKQEEHLARLLQDIVAVDERIDELSAQVQAASPAYNQLIDSVTTSDQVLSILAQDEALVQILLAPEQSFVFYVRGDRVRVYEAPVSRRRVGVIVENLRRAFDLSSGSLVTFDVAESYALFESLFAPFAEDLRSVEHIVSVPSGPLLSFPFGLFVTEPPPKIENENYLDVQWLANPSSISLVPSARSFVDLRSVAQPSSAPQSFIGFGDFQPFGAGVIEQAKNSLSVQCQQNPTQIQEYRSMMAGLVELPMTRSELQKVAATFSPGSSTVVLGNEFTEDRLKSSPLSDYRVLYFATHALLPSEVECQPQPALVASVPAASEGQDGLIDASEILGLKLNADMVVLSACNTGGPGTSTGGESLSGLARAFFYAGARSLVVSHWQVEDTATADLMSEMFGQLRSGARTSSAQALQTAQASIIDDASNPDTWFRSHPVFWGAFTLVGDGRRSLGVL